MKNNNTNRNDLGKLRKRAEKILNKNASQTGSKLSEDEMIKLIYELEVHQVELELQNEELKKSQTAANNYAERYHELYDFAPIGYMTLSKEGAINEINLCASQMLDKERSNLKKSRLGFFISDETKPVFNFFLLKIFSEGIKQVCEVTLLVENKPAMNVSLTGIIGKDEEQCLVTILDITDQKRAEDELKKWANLFLPKTN